MGSLGPVELIIILAIVLLLFGSRKLPELAKSLGKAQREFKQGMRDGENDAPAPTSTPAPTPAKTEDSTTS
jgi:sec-independent protein translocase protein TatA